MPQLILLGFIVVTVYVLSAVTGVQPNQGPPIKSSFETVYFGEIDEKKIRLKDSLELNTKGLDTLSSVLRTYTEDGLLIREDHHDFKPDKKKKEYSDYWVEFEYDLKDSLILETVYAEGKVLYTILSRRNNDGYITSRREGEKFPQTCDYEYNKNGQMISSVCEGFMYSVRAVYGYDERGRRSYIQSSSGSDFMWETYFFYDDSDRAIQDSTVKLQKNYNPAKGEPDFVVEYSQVMNYAYNDHGDLEKISGDKDERYYYEYDKYGNWIVKMNISSAQSWLSFATITVREITYVAE